MEESISEVRYNSWTAIGQTSNQLILYHPPSHALQVQPHPSLASSSSIPGPSGPSRRPLRLIGDTVAITDDPIENITTVPHCPYCSQPMPNSASHERPLQQHDRYRFDASPHRSEQAGSDRGRNKYFRILEKAHEGSRPPSPSPSGASTPRKRYRTPLMDNEDEDELDEADFPARGYYDRFFKEECKLGMGAEGSVFLATHVIGGNILGTYAVKKIAVGRSKSYLFKMLREVRLLEALRHPNIIPYHHSWIDVTRFSNFGPPIVALHVLMQYATAGNLDTYLLTRSHTNQPRPDLSAGDIADSESLGQLPKAERIKAFKRRRQSAAEGVAGKARPKKREEMRGVLLLSAEEVMKLFSDVVEGLAFLHANSILHLDLKCSNVLLHWEEGKLIPKALISDFGTSEEMLRGKRERTGHTGTMEYMAPETLMQDLQGNWRPSDSHADMWSLGMILHKMLFLHLPYPDTEDFDELHKEILSYPGFKPSSEIIQSLERRHIPRDLLILLSKLESLVPEERPGAEKVRAGLKGLEQKIRSTPTTLSSKAGELVRRFASPWSSKQDERDDGDQDVPVQHIPDSYSPVKTILALPSPQTEFAANRNPTMLSDNGNDTIVSGRPQERIGNVMHSRYSGSLSINRRHSGRAVRGIIFVIKVISLQPAITGRPLSITYLILLLVLALFEVIGEVSLGISVLLGAIHIGVLSYSNSNSDSNSKMGGITL
ncbi:uncharacterized protein I303_101715 [Kwoniella dejecticola CBS 10117]|uniref:IKS protein kinase n=1 Tax=Kwoniella dejecticola CBS 10117 TaxID=1296121 RepID=A0A1A6AD10_9TREE|nr:IKS protein kinase [Kwoniella dejecticola CBS 10117]OBR87933.1 IKS protein kinase [Kwoniella dejecticola CBS 10117]